jgi:hypothetical protein
MSFNIKINNIILSEIKVFLDSCEYTQENSIDIFNELKLFLNISSMDITVKAAKTPRKIKDIPMSERCIALTKDEHQCKKKRQLTGTEPELCSNHNKTGAKFGYVPVDGLQEDVEESEIEVEAPQEKLKKSEIEVEAPQKKSSTKKSKKVVSDIEDVGEVEF